MSVPFYADVSFKQHFDEGMEMEANIPYHPTYDGRSENKFTVRHFGVLYFRP